jgi:predicted SAM-dependent methyltransferase
MSLETPVALLIYNRPEPTAQVLSAIARARPRRLFVVGDGPRAGRPGNAEQVAAARAVLERVDWPCDVQTNYSAVNLGCRRRVASGLDWVFENADQAIIVEDDCVPDLSFFGFCEQLLARYRNDERVHSISGTNFFDQSAWTPHSYFFSKYFLCWGWATWRRAWRSFDSSLGQWPAWRQSGGLKAFAESPEEERYWARLFDAESRGELDSWATAFAFASFKSGGLQVIPSVNLVSNIGFGGQATHTTRSRHRLANLPARSIGELRHPPQVARSAAADQHIFAHAYASREPSRWKRLRTILERPWRAMRSAFKALRGQRRIWRLRRELAQARQRRIIIGASGTSQAGWLATDIAELNLLLPEKWRRVCEPSSLDAIVAEHVWEHLTAEEGVVAAKTCFEYLKPGGHVRVAVPDGLHPDPSYVESVRPLGTGPGADDHRVLYNHRTLRQTFEAAGFVVRLQEYFDEQGRFHSQDWDPADGHIRRSRRFDPRNAEGKLNYTSIILDAVKPAAAQIAARPRTQAA